MCVVKGKVEESIKGEKNIYDENCRRGYIYIYAKEGMAAVFTREINEKKNSLGILTPVFYQTAN